MMHANDLDVAYTELAQALGRVGEPLAPLLLATLSLSLLAKLENLDEALSLIQQAQALSQDQPFTPAPE